VTKQPVPTAALSKRSRWSVSGQILLQKWATFVVHHPWLTLIVSGLLTVALAVFAANNLGVSTNTEDMIDNRLEWRQDFVTLRNQFPQHYRALAIVIDAQTEALAQQTIWLLLNRFSASLGNNIRWLNCLSC